MNKIESLTPKKIVTELDKFIIGQNNAKKAIAIAIRNRWRRQQLSFDMRKEVTPKNIIMIGSTGVGKTEMARRLASLAQVPFIKVEVTKFTEVGYIGGNIESIVRDLLEISIQMVRDKMSKRNCKEAKEATDRQLLNYLLSHIQNFPKDSEQPLNTQECYTELKEQLDKKLLEEKEIEITIADNILQHNIPNRVGIEQIMPQVQNLFQKLVPKSSIQRCVTVREARNIIFQQELDKLIDHDKMHKEAIELTENSGIVFLDEIDKICGSQSFGPDVSREGVQRDLLPLVEGTFVNTNHGIVKTDHILFVAAGAFSNKDVSDLMPELYGRFPIQVQLEELSQEHFYQILIEPRNALIRQQIALLSTEGIELEFTDDGIKKIAQKAYNMNQQQQNIGARRLHAIMEKVLEQISFDAPNCANKKYIIDSGYVNLCLKKAECDEEQKKFGFSV